MNESKADGFLDETKGKIKRVFGEATGNERVANSGAVDQVKGNAEQTWGNVKDAAHDATHSTTATTTEHDAHATGSNLRENVVSGAEHVKDSVKRGIEDLQTKLDR